MTKLGTTSDAQSSIPIEPVSEMHQSASYPSVSSRLIRPEAKRNSIKGFAWGNRIGILSS